MYMILCFVIVLPFHLDTKLETKLNNQAIIFHLFVWISSISFNIL